MSKIEQYRDITNKLFKAMNSSEFDEFETFLSESVIFDFPGAGQVEGRKRVLIFLKTLLRKYPGLTFTVSDIIIEDNLTCAVWTNKGESTKGEAYENSGMTFIRFENDQIVFMSDYFKDTSFVK